MTKVLAATPSGLVVRAPRDRDDPLGPRSAEAWGRWLRGRCSDEGSRRALRLAAALVAPHEELTRLTQADVAELVARALERGRIGAVVAEPPVVAVRSIERSEPPPPPPAKQRTWIAIRLLDNHDPPRPVPLEPYRLTLSDGTVLEGRLDEKGMARVEDIDPGTCKVSFPRRHGADWRKR